MWSRMWKDEVADRDVSIEIIIGYVNGFVYYFKDGGKIMKVFKLG